MNRTSKISAGQIIILFASAGVLYAVVRGSYAPAGTMLTNGVLSALLSAVLSVPLCIYAARGSGEDIISALSVKGKIFGKIAAVLYSVYFIASAAEITRVFGVFAAERIFPEAGFGVCAGLTGLACVYISHTGTQAVCRMTTLIFFLMTAGAVLFGVFGYRDILSADRGLFSGGRGEILSGYMLTGAAPFFMAACVTVCVLCGDAGDGGGRGLMWGIAAMLGVFSAAAAAVWAVLGRFTEMSEYPALDAAMYIGRRGEIPFYGGLYALWIIAAAAVISMLCACGGRTLKEIFPRLKGEGALAAFSSAVLALICGYTHSSFCGVIFGGVLFPTVLLMIPTVIAVMDKKGKSASVSRAVYRKE